MRSLPKRRFGSILAPVLAFALPVIVMALAFMIAQVPPGEVLPVEATLRRNPMDKDCLCTVTKMIDDISTIKSQIGSSNPMVRDQGGITILTEYMDPFFIVALMLPGSLLEGFLMFAYFLRFGLASLAMFHLLKNRIRSGRYFAIMLSTFYAAGSVAYLAAGSVQVMNLMILLPLVFAFMDERITSDDGASYIKLVGISALLFISGMPGLICGGICALMFAVLVSFMRYRTFGGVISALSRITGALFPGLLLSGLVNVPVILALDIDKIDETIFEDPEMSYKLFDFISSASSGMAQNSQFAVNHAFYLGIITFILMVILFFNTNIPIRLKVTTGVLGVICHVLVSYSAFVKLISFPSLSTSYPAVILTGLAVIVVAMAAVSVKNIRNAGRTCIYAGGLAVICIMVIANSSENVYGFMNYQLFMTFISAVGVTVFLLHVAEKGSSKAAIVYGALSFIVLTSNMTYVYMMSDVRPSDYKAVRYADSAIDSPEIEASVDLGFLTSTDKFIVVDSDILPMTDGRDVPTIVNGLCDLVGLGQVFEPVQTEELMNIGFTRGDSGMLRITEEDSELLMGIDLIGEERLVMGSGLEAPLKVSELNYNIADLPMESRFTGPFLYELSNTTGSFEVSVSGDPTGTNEGIIGLYTVNEEALEALGAIMGNIDGGSVGSGTGKFVITGIAYDKDVKAYIGGTEVPVSDFMGRACARVSGDLSGDLKISRNGNGLLVGLVLAISGLLCVAGHEIIDKRIRRLG